jgi:hypothetical protein
MNQALGAAVGGFTGGFGGGGGGLPTYGYSTPYQATGNPLGSTYGMFNR